jgi:hypothetical protein
VDDIRELLDAIPIDNRSGAQAFLVGLYHAREQMPLGFAFAPDADYDNWMEGYLHLFAGADLVS